MEWIDGERSVYCIISGSDIEMSINHIIYGLYSEISQNRIRDICISYNVCIHYILFGSDSKKSVYCIISVYHIMTGSDSERLVLYYIISG